MRIQFTQIGRPWRVLGLVVLGMSFLTSAAAHDFWIEPAVFSAKPGARVPLRIFVGEEFSGEPVPFLPERFVRYVSVGPDGARPIPGVLGDDPAGVFTPTAGGRYIIALHTKPYEVTFDTGEEFERYLEKEGLEHNLDRHRQRYTPGKKILETYFRCAKALISVTPETSAAPDRALGLPLELVAEALPTRAGSQSPVRLRLNYLGKPLDGALVMLSNKAKPKDKIKLRADAEGRVATILPQGGVWLATAVHMVPAPFYVKEDWNSLWASLSFELR